MFLESTVIVQGASRAVRPQQRTPPIYRNSHKWLREVSAACYTHIQGALFDLMYSWGLPASHSNLGKGCKSDMSQLLNARFFACSSSCLHLRSPRHHEQVEVVVVVVAAEEPL